jgi:GNAT superfamily N-acetyltransferase
VIRVEAFDEGIAAGQIAVRAIAEAGVVGVALADVQSTPHVGRLQSIYVSDRYRQRGIASRLLRALEQQARVRGARQMQTLYDKMRASAGAVSRVLAKAGWVQPHASMLMLELSPRLQDAPWVRPLAPTDYEIFVWSQLTASERTSLAARESAASWPQALGPFPDEPVEPTCSVGARHKGEVVGWLLTHRIRPTVLRHSRLFVAREHRARFCGLALVAEALRRQRLAGIPNSLCAVASDNQPMLRIVRRRLEAYVDAKTEVCHAEKDI